MTENLELNRMRWRCRRGLLELDLLLGPFFEAMYLTLEADQQLSFQLLLEQEDPDLLEWFSQKSRSTDPGMAALVDLMLKRVQPPS
ncbi:succinate dehydrogenase assembly factor 2 [Pseudomonadales bacterium]|nr:succinate dehydrogenase assembly factor 2 [Pseudomonadales bacterium]MDB4068411.1 succinate dehydrogenase assembly factor 2 [Pseudomonadales bacterium]MDB9866338.1 succinate dehydrogenase assembly factor 2 [Pseudomonadales bacterium]MDB9878945.1 succinate dehydrogenase assembly factor 2 [Pseudomonadales bacterium]MDB9916389.1 succinate dehydrogenase assembly factor 2 [Pseudomonadales bacterium]|tara:strand:+ start:1066 stop:1323 length:258 start_codon:yes stop_codon:yes gene_type:complete